MGILLHEFLFEDLAERIPEFDQRVVIKANLGALTGPVDGLEPDSGGFAVDDRLRDLNAGFAVLIFDGEGDIDDVGLVTLDGHGKSLSALWAVVE